MGDWWTDESLPVGPYQVEGWTEIIQGFTDSLGLALEPFIVLGRQYGKLFVGMDPAGPWSSGPATYYTIADEINLKPEVQRELEKADVSAAVPLGTHAKIAKQFGDISEREQKRQIGRGNVAGHGPRGGTTFGRGGRRRY